MGNKQTEGRNEEEIKTSITTVKEVFNKEKTIFFSNLNPKIRKKIHKVLCVEITIIWKQNINYRKMRQRLRETLNVSVKKNEEN